MICNKLEYYWKINSFQWLVYTQADVFMPYFVNYTGFLLTPHENTFTIRILHQLYKKKHLIYLFTNKCRLNDKMCNALNDNDITVWLASKLKTHNRTFALRSKGIWATQANITGRMKDVTTATCALLSWHNTMMQLFIQKEPQLSIDSISTAVHWQLLH